MISPVRCPACGNVNPPEYPPEQFSFCMECGAQLGAFRPPAAPDPYGQPPQHPYGGPQGGPPPGQYGQQPQQPYGGPQGGYGGPPIDPYAGQSGQPGGYGGQQGGYGGQPAGPPPGPYGQQPHGPYGAPQDAGPYQQQHAAAVAKLILESGLGKIEYPLDAGVVTIGRSRSNDISLDDARVSRHHARVVRGDRGYLIEDLNSRNGTRVDDRAIRDSAPLAEGSVVKIGDAVFRFTASTAMPNAQQSPPATPGPSPWDHVGGAQMGPGGPPAGPQTPVLFMSPWNPLQCPSCQGLKTMIQIVYGPAAQSPGAQTAARRGEVIIGDGPAHPDGPNAECRACGTRVRIVQSSS